MNKILAIMLAGAACLAGLPAGAAEVGRFQAVVADSVVLIDTLTGRSWMLSKEGGWHVIPFVHDAGQEPAVGSNTPEGPATPMERWRKDAGARRLDQMKPSMDQNKPPADKDTVRKVLEGLGKTTP